MFIHRYFLVSFWAAATLCSLWSGQLRAELCEADTNAMATGTRVPVSTPLRPVADAGGRHYTINCPSTPTTVVMVDIATSSAMHISEKTLPSLRVSIPFAGMPTLNDKKRGALASMLLAFPRSPDVTAALQRIDAAGVPLEIHYGSSYYDYEQSATGVFVPVTRPFAPEQRGHVGYAFSANNDTVVIPGITVHVSINELYFSDGFQTPTSTQQFAATLLKELIRIIVPGHGGADEAAAEQRSGPAYDALFRNLGYDKLLDSEAPEMAAGLIAHGTAATDVINGADRNDSLSGGDGSDMLNGQGGDDTLMGDQGNDRLAGGTGNNVLEGGSGDDTYTIVGGAFNLVMDVAGFDTVTVPFNIANVALTRDGDTLYMALPDGSSVQIDRQWVLDSRIERFIFGTSVFTAAQVEQRALPADGGCYQQGEQTVCF